MIELLLEVPPETTAVITVQFSRAFLKWTEHPPDAHHGFYIKYSIICKPVPQGNFLFHRATPK